MEPLISIEIQSTSQYKSDHYYSVPVEITIHNMIGVTQLD
jgi:hypothetical protein